jgi:cell division septal protein FtsQ
MPMNISPFEEPENAPELLKERSENLSDREGAFWQQATNGYQRTAGGETQRAAAANKGKSQPKKKKTNESSAGMRAALALVALAGITVCVLYFIVFRVREIRVEGNELISRSDVIRLSGVRYGSSILTRSEEITGRDLEARAVS